MTHIILLDGKLWAFEPPPEKPELEPTIFGAISGIRNDEKMEAYNRAYSLTLEKKVEIDRSSFTDSCLISRDGQAKSMSFNVDGIRYYLDVNEPIKWEGGYSIIEGPKRLIRLIAQVKEGLIEKLNKVSDKLDAEDKERRRLTFDRLSVNADAQHPNSAMSYTEGSEDDTVYEVGKYKGEPVPSEQENQEEMWQRNGWTLSRERMPDVDGEYLIYGFLHTECGNVYPFQKVVTCRFNQWVKSDVGEQMTYWRPLLLPPIIKSIEDHP